MVGAAVVMGLAAYLLCAPNSHPVRVVPPHRISRASFEQIREGMTRAEVEALLGVPPGEYRDEDPDSPSMLGDAVIASLSPDGPVGSITYRWLPCEEWMANADRICVFFTHEGGATVKIWQPIMRYRLRPLDRLRRRIGW
jgi:hypothetical protein